jgi:hypothetical protein
MTDMGGGSVGIPPPPSGLENVKIKRKNLKRIN